MINHKIINALEFMQYDYEKALKLFNEVLEVEPTNIEAINGKGSTLMKLHKMDEAEKYFDYSLSIIENSSALINKGILSKNKQDYENALIYYNKAIEIDSNLNNIISILKNEVMEKLDMDYVINLGNFNQEAKILIKKGIIYEKSGKLWDAWDCFLKAIEKDVTCENLIDPFISKIKTIIKNEFLFKTPQLDNAKKDKLKNVILKTLFIEEDLEKALSLLNEILRGNSNDLDALNYKGCILFYFDETEKSLECFDKCLKIDNTDIYALFNKALVLRSSNKLPEALICFDKLLDYDETYNKAKAYQLEILGKLII
ncbi:tetratricopeptide repeat protein [Methanobrevibacter oralis]|uniref:Tetratricopeptide repeat protein n=1 Tax=Methanobrevibacter oralis TaxID=66851 RepID=A0A166B6V8_METOA|nr:tetratricopeptide repeat protein [Methanobrevibacter oralis]KZX12946.1 tetratricopeptide repeat protein [Methanobrevibacter oralis]